MKKNNEIKVVFESKTILVTKAFMKDAQVYDSKAYRKLMKIQDKHPDFEVETVSARKKPTGRKVHFRGLTYKYMEEYIKAHDQAEERMKAFEETKLRAKPTSNPYKQVQDWFLKIYPEMKIAA